MKWKNPGDLEILNAIYDTYLERFVEISDTTAESGEKVYTSIDVKLIADKLGMSKHVLFGRLRYHLDNKYRYQDENGVWTHLFAQSVGTMRHAIHFPYLSAVVAEKEREWRRFAISLAFSAIALVVSIIALAMRT